MEPRSLFSTAYICPFSITNIDTGTRISRPAIVAAQTASRVVFGSAGGRNPGGSSYGFYGLRRTVCTICKELQPRSGEGPARRTWVQDSARIGP
jgi:hypothetical protein